jgi:hypothetical protein
MFGASKASPAILPAPPPVPFMFGASKATSAILPVPSPVPFKLGASKALHAIPPAPPHGLTASPKYDFKELRKSVLCPWEPNSRPDFPVKSDPNFPGRPLKFSPHLPPARPPEPNSRRFPTPGAVQDLPKVAPFDFYPSTGNIMRTRSSTSPFLSSAALAEMVAQADADPYLTKRKQKTTTLVAPPTALPAPSGPIASERSLLSRILAKPYIPPTAVQRLLLLVKFADDLPESNLPFKSCIDGPLWSQDGKMILPQPEKLSPATNLTYNMVEMNRPQRLSFEREPRRPSLIVNIPTDEERYIPKSSALEREIEEKLDQEAKKRER